MDFLNKWERKLGWMSFPGFLRYYALFHVMVFGLQFISPGIGDVLSFDREKIFEGEVWRLVTFLFATSGFRGVGALAILFLFFMVMIAFMMSDALEQEWGVFKTSMFFYVGVLGLLLANFLFRMPMPGSGFFIYQGAFFAFATLFPRVEFRLFLILPVQVRYLAMLLGVFLVLGVLSYLPWVGFAMLAFGNYFFWAGLPALRGGMRVMEAKGRKRKFESAAFPEGEAFHRCKVCGRTEVSDPELEFRMAVDGEEYCDEHLPD